LCELVWKMVADVVHGEIVWRWS